MLEYRFPHLMRIAEDIAGEAFLSRVAGDIRAAALPRQCAAGAATAELHPAAAEHQEADDDDAEDRNRPAAQLAPQQHRQQPDQQPADASTAAAAKAEPAATATAPEIADVVAGIIIVEPH